MTEVHHLSQTALARFIHTAMIAAFLFSSPALVADTQAPSPASNLSRAERMTIIKALITAGIKAFESGAASEAKPFFEAVLLLDPNSMVAQRFLKKIVAHERAHWAPVVPNDV